MLQLPDDGDANRVADWVELVLATGEDSISKTKVASILGQGSGDDPNEAFLSDIWGHLGRRAARLTVPFFRLEHDLAISSCADLPSLIEYKVCLFFSLYGASNQHRSDPKLFERLVAEAVSIYVGGKKFIFGWPVLSDVEADIGLRVRQVATATKERFVEAPAVRYKDRGVDVISWKPFPEPDLAEHRTSQYIMLSQCAAGRDWRSKTQELPLKAWTQYIHWSTDPMRGFAASCVIDDDLWHDIAREVSGVVFDRIRLLNLVSSGVSDQGLKAELKEWTIGQLEEWTV